MVKTCILNKLIFKPNSLPIIIWKLITVVATIVFSFGFPFCKMLSTPFHDSMDFKAIGMVICLIFLIDTLLTFIIERLDL